jgi:tetratricopeptide (TPR) repeat protein
MADYNEAIRIDPKYAPPYINRGKARGDNGELDRAIADYDEAIRVDPKFALSYYNRGKTWSDKGELDRAIADYNEAIRLDPNFAVAYNNRGDTRFEKGDLERAIADYNEAIRIDPKFAAAYSNRGSARLAKGDLDRAIVDLNEAIRIDPSFVFAYNNRGEIWLEKGDLDRAVADFNAALKLNPKNAESLYGRGIAKLNKGDSAGSQADIQAATAINPDVADEFDATEVQFRFNVLTDIVVDRAKHKVEFFGMFDPRGPARRIPYAQFLANALQLPEESGTSGGIGSVPGFSLEPTIFRAWSHDDTLAIGRAFVSELKSFATGHDNLLLLPPGSVERVLGQRMWVRPTFFGIPANTAFARAVFESDVAFKSLVGPAGLKLKQDLPYHQALLEWVYQHCDLSAGSLFSIMVQPDNFQLSVAGDASFIRFDNAQLRIEVRSRVPNQSVPDCVRKYAEFLSAHFDDYARQIAALWRIREAFKIVAAARYLKDSGFSYGMSRSSETWSAPSQISADWDVAFMRIGNDGGLLTTFAGGVDMQVRGRTHIKTLASSQVPNPDRLRYVRLGNLFGRNAPLSLVRSLAVAGNEKMCTGHNHCNYFAGAVGAAAGIPYFRDILTDPIEDDRVANKVYGFVANAVKSPSSGWQRIDMREAQQLANEGKFVVVVAEGLNGGSGHIGFAAPESLGSDKALHTAGLPWIRDSDHSSKSVTANYAFSSLSGHARTVTVGPPIWAVWKGPVCSARVRCVSP